MTNLSFNNNILKIINKPVLPAGGDEAGARPLLPHHRAVFVLLAAALVVLQRNAPAVLQAALDLIGQPSGSRFPLTESLRGALLQRHAGK